MLNTSFLSRSLEFGHRLGRGCTLNQPPVKNLGTGFLMSFFGRQHSTCTVRSLLPEELSTTYGTPLGEDSWSLALGFLQTSILCIFFLC